MEPIVNKELIEAMRRKQLRQDRETAKRIEEETRQLKLMLWPVLEWFAENGDDLTATQAEKAMSDWSHPLYRSEWEKWARERGYFNMVASAAHDRRAFT